MERSGTIRKAARRRRLQSIESRLINHYLGLLSTIIEKTTSKETVSIALRRNSSYANLVKSVMESGELSYDQSDVVKVVGRSREEASASALPPVVDDTSMEYDCMSGDEWDNSKDHEEKSVEEVRTGSSDGQFGR
ncbi:hypothetical protein FXO37_29253 [Capsicum annuum]|nr:hypothetical protein FXO37_29253 [Capsicum annuum]